MDDLVELVLDAGVEDCAVLTSRGVEAGLRLVSVSSPFASELVLESMSATPRWMGIA